MKSVFVIILFFLVFGSIYSQNKYTEKIYSGSIEDFYHSLTSVQEIIKQSSSGFSVVIEIPFELKKNRAHLKRILKKQFNLDAKMIRFKQLKEEKSESYRIHIFMLNYDPFFFQNLPDIKKNYS